MGRTLVLIEPETITIEDYPEPLVGPNEVRIRTLFSGISAGTEMAWYRGSNPHVRKRWDSERRLFVSSEEQRLRYPIEHWGYEEVGEVVECGEAVTTLQNGDLVFGTWGHRTHHVLDEEDARARVLPAGLDPVLGIFSHIGSVALNGVHDAGIRIGETVAVFGLGVVGQIVAQLAARSGAYVIGVDLHDDRLSLARELGAIETSIRADQVATAERIKALTEGRGADVSIEVTGSTVALHEAIRTTAYAGRVVAMGFFQGAAGGLFLGEEFHHNRINLVCSQISGVAPELSYRWNRIRLAQTVMRLQSDGHLRLMPLISHRYPFEQAAEAFRRLDKAPAQIMQVVLEFGQNNTEL